jgi:hypothetical protein
MTANENTPPVTKEAAAKLSQKCWKELTKENVFDAWAIMGIPSDTRVWASIPQDETEPIDQAMNDQEGSGTDVEFGHDYIDMADILTVEKTSQCSDGESEDNVKGGIK